MKGRVKMQVYGFYVNPNNEANAHKKTDLLPPPILKTEGWKFNRDEANERRKADLLLPPTLDTRGWKFDREKANERSVQT